MTLHTIVLLHSHDEGTSFVNIAFCAQQIIDGRPLGAKLRFRTFAPQP